MTSRSRNAGPASGRPAARSRAGRPSREQAAQLRERILEVATELLFAHGYGGTSIEAIARRAGVSKRTFYQRFADKPALMSAVIVRLIDSLRPPPEVPLIEGEGLHQMLVHLGSLILHAALSPRVLQLQRLIVAESSRFPDLAAAVARSGGRREAVTLIAELLARQAPAPGIAAGDASFAAQQFLQMIVSLPQSRALGLGGPMAPAELDAWVRDTVALFLEGCRGIAGRRRA
jgi:AcrR family transcriptional regulator